MKKFTRYIVAILFQFSFAALLLLITIRFQILNPDFLITSLRNAGAYRQSVELFKEYLGDTVAQELRAAGLDKLPIQQQQILEDQITGLTSAIEEKEVQDLAETNIHRFYSYINGETNEIVLYFPVHTWGLPDLITSQEPYSLLTENTPLETVMGVENAENAKVNLLQTREYVKIIKVVWFIPLVLSILLLLVNYLLSDSPGRLKSTAWLIVVSGIYTLLMSGTAYVGSNEFVDQTVSYGEPILLIMGTIIPFLFLLIINLWAKIAGVMIFTGVIILIVQLAITKRNERKKKERQNPAVLPTVAMPTQPAPKQNSLNTIDPKVGQETKPVDMR